MCEQSCKLMRLAAQKEKNICGGKNQNRHLVVSLGTAVLQGLAAPWQSGDSPVGQRKTQKYQDITWQVDKTSP